MKSSQDIDSLLGARARPNGWVAPGRLELVKPTRCRFSTALPGGPWVIGTGGRHGDSGGGMYWLSIGGARVKFAGLGREGIGEFENERPVNCSCGARDLFCTGSRADGRRDSLRFGTCDGGIKRLCWYSARYESSFTILVTVAVSITAGSSSSLVVRASSDVSFSLLGRAGRAL